jgi:hypothetical protein
MLMLNNVGKILVEERESYRINEPKAQDIIV